MEAGMPQCNGVPASGLHLVGLLDLPVVGYLCGGGDRRSNLDLRTLHIGKPARTLAFGDPSIILFLQILLGILDGFR